MKLRLLSILVFMMGQMMGSTAFADDNSQQMKDQRKQAIKSGKAGKTIDYGPKNAKAAVWIFTDLNCPACKELHDDANKLANLGVQVHFMAFPRRGLNSPGYTKLVSVWCSKDPVSTLEHAMEGKSVSQQTCENPVKAQFMLGHRFGILGTPTIVFADGTQWSGYYSPEKIARESEKHGK